jgi:hypothetical protein
MSARVDVEVKKHLEAMHRELVSAESAAFNSPGQSPGSIAQNGLALKGRNRMDDSVAPFQGWAFSGNRTPWALPWADESRPVGAGELEEDLDGEEILQPRRLSLRVF